MPVRPMRLETDENWVLDEATPQEVRGAVLSLPDREDGWVLLMELGGSFVQVAMEGGRQMQLSWCDLDAGRSRRAWSKDVPLQTVADACARYVELRDDWMLPFRWHGVEVIEPLATPASPRERALFRNIRARQRWRGVRRARLISFALAANALAVWIIAGFFSHGVGRWASVVIGLALTALAWGMHRVGYRCPECNARLGWRRRRHCPHCHVRLY